MKPAWAGARAQGNSALDVHVNTAFVEESFMRKRLDRNGESGVALLSAILILMLMSALLIGFIAMVNSDQAASGINRDQTQAYAAAHAGVEKMTADLGQLFRRTSPQRAPR